jgi:BirA family biotin operon repressor/biotin-[acetyl-CoA-carboxylase] ligase
MTPQEQESIDQPTVTLEQISTITVDRNRIVAMLIKSLTDLMETFHGSRFSSWRARWGRLDRIHGREVKVARGNEITRGTAKGIDDMGALLVDKGNDTHARFFSGDVSLRLDR